MPQIHCYHLMVYAKPAVVAVVVDAVVVDAVSVDAVSVDAVAVDAVAVAVDDSEKLYLVLSTAVPAGDQDHFGHHYPHSSQQEYAHFLQWVHAYVPKFVERIPFDFLVDFLSQFDHLNVALIVHGYVTGIDDTSPHDCKCYDPNSQMSRPVSIQDNNDQIQLFRHNAYIVIRDNLLGNL